MDLPQTAEDILPTLNRPMPFSDEAEKGVLSCILQDPERLTRAFNAMPTALFYHEGNREIFTTMVDELVANRPIDPVSLTHRLRSNGRLDHVGGAASISELYSFVPVASHFQYYLGTLRTLYTQRKNIEAHVKALDGLFKTSEADLPAALDAAKGLIEEAGKMPGQALKSRSVAESIGPLLDEIEVRAANPGRLPGITTGMTTLDKHTGGMMPGQVWVFAGEPGDGKSTIMQNLAEAAAAEGNRVRWYPLEMTHNEQVLRLLASSAGVDNSKIYSGIMARGEQMALTGACGRLQRLKIDLVDVEDATATDILADMERSDAPIIVLDYLQLLDDSGGRKSDTRETVLANISRRAKRLARRTGKTILTASQLNDSGRLRESRAIGQDADKVFLVKKFEDKNSETGFDDERRILWCDKNRGGRRHWEVPLRFMGSVFQFKEEIG